MPEFEMPLAELATYRGRNPRPVDFDEYWTAALAELAAVDPAVVLEPVSLRVPGVEAFDLWYTGVRGARIHAKYLRPTGASTPVPAVLRFHGYSGDAGDWAALLPFASLGVVVAAMDCRGQGGLSEDVGGVRGNTLHGHIIRGLDGSPEDLLYRQIFLDTAQLVDVVSSMPEVDASRLAATGESQGGALTVACAALRPTIRLAAPVFPFLADYQRVWEMDLAEDAYGELQEYFRRFDPRHEREVETFTRLGYIDIQHLAPRIEASVLWSLGQMDRICPPSTQFAVYNAIKSTKRMVRYPDFGHEPLPGGQDAILDFLADL